MSVVPNGTKSRRVSRLAICLSQDDSFQNNVRILDYASGNEIRRYSASVAALSADRQLLAGVTSASDDAKKAAGNGAPSYRPAREPPPPGGDPKKAAGDGQQPDKRPDFIQVWEVATGKEIGKWPSQNNSTLLAFSADKRSVYSWDTDKKVRVWDIGTGKLVRDFGGKSFWADANSPNDYYRIFRHAFSPDGKLVALGNQASQIDIFELATGKRVQQLMGAGHSLSALAFSADTRILAVGDWEGGAIHLFEIASGKEFQQFNEHKARAHDLAFSADGSRLLSGNDDTTRSDGPKVAS